MATSKKKKTQQSTAVAVPIPGTLSIQGPLPVTGNFEGTVRYAKQNWEYIVVDMGNTPAAIQATLNNKGREGWELVQTYLGGMSIFKRPL